MDLGCRTGVVSRPALCGVLINLPRRAQAPRAIRPHGPSPRSHMDTGVHTRLDTHLLSFIPGARTRAYTHALTLTCTLIHGWPHTHLYLTHAHTRPLYTTRHHLSHGCRHTSGLCQPAPCAEDRCSGGLPALTVGLPILCQVLAALGPHP